jgi:hypothetical protein
MDHHHRPAQTATLRLRMITGTPAGKQPDLTYPQVRRLLWRADSELRRFGSGWTAQTNQVLERLLFMMAKNPDKVIPSSTWLSQALRISRRSVISHINRLAKAGLINKHERTAIWEDLNQGQDQQPIHFRQHASRLAKRHDPARGGSERRCL